MQDTTVTLTAHEVSELLEMVQRKIEDNKELAVMECKDDAFDYNAEAAFWKALETKLLAK